MISLQTAPPTTHVVTALVHLTRQALDQVLLDHAAIKHTQDGDIRRDGPHIEWIDAHNRSLQWRLPLVCVKSNGMVTFSGRDLKTDQIVCTKPVKIEALISAFEA